MVAIKKQQLVYLSILLLAFIGFGLMQNHSNPINLNTTMNNTGVSPHNATDNITLTENIKSTGGDNIPSATLNFQDIYNSGHSYQATTDSNGNAIIAIGNGTYELTAQKMSLDGIMCTILDVNFSIDGSGPSTVYRPDIAALKAVKLTLYDVDSNLVQNATVTFVKSDDSTFISSAISTSNGIASIQELTNNQLYNYNITLTLGLSTYVLQNGTLDVTIANPDDFSQADSVLNCNMTSVNFLCWDDRGGLNNNLRPLYNVNITIADVTGTNITSFYSNTQGQTILKVPQTSWTFTVSYQGLPRSFYLNLTGYTTPTTSLTLNLLSNDIGTQWTLMNITISQASTLIVLNQTIFANTGGAWNSSGIQTNNLVSAPYSVSLYYGDAVMLPFYYQDTVALTYITTTTGQWNLTSTANGIQVNGSDSVNMSPLGFNLTIYTTDYMAGSYQLNLWATLTGYQTAYYQITITIANQTTSLTQIDDPNPSVILDTNVTFDVIYNISAPVVTNVIQPIRWAYVLQYYIQGTSVTGILANQTTPGEYRCNFNASIASGLTAGSYTIVVYGNVTNDQWQQILVGLTILNKPTGLSVILNSNELLAANYVRHSVQNNLTFLINYTQASGVPFPSYTNAIVNVTDSSGVLHPFISYIGAGIYNCTINCSSAAISLYQLTVMASQNYYYTNTTIIQAELIDYWNTQQSVVVIPNFGYWGNNISFIVYYSCNQDPRTGWALNNATVSEVDLMLLQNSVYVTQVTLNSTNRNVNTWGWCDLSNNVTYGPGYYLIWFNASVTTVSSQTTFYIRPFIGYGEYRIASTILFTQISPVGTAILAFQTDDLTQQPLSYLSFARGYNNGSYGVQLVYNVTSVGSQWYGMNVSNANITYVMINNVNQAIVPTSGIVNLRADGSFNFTLDTTTAGQYTIYINATLPNYITGSCSFIYLIGLNTFTANGTIDPKIALASTAIELSILENVSFWVQYSAPNPTITVTYNGLQVNSAYIYILNSSAFYCTFPVQIYSGTGSFSLVVLLQKLGYADNNATQFSVNVFQKWQAQLILNQPGGIVPQSNNVTFNATYSGNQGPRLNVPILTGNITQLSVVPKTGGTTINFTLASLGTSWWYSNLGTGTYTIIFTSTIFNVVNATGFYASCYLTDNASIYQNVSSFVSLEIGTVATLITLTAPNLSGSSPLNQQSLTLNPGQEVDILAYWNVTDPTSVLYGENISIGTLQYILYNTTSGTPVYFSSGNAIAQPNGTYLLSLTIAQRSLYSIYFGANATNFQNGNLTAYFAIQVGYYTVGFSVSESPFFQIAPPALDMKAALGENVSLTVTFESDQITLNPSLIVSIENSLNSTNSTDLGSCLYPTGLGTFYCTFPANSFETGQYILVLVGSITGQLQQYLPETLQFGVNIVSTWDTSAIVVVPPYLYPWDNISSFIITYNCTDLPRNQLVTLNSATVSQMIITNQAGDWSTTLGPDTLNTIWGYSNLQSNPQYGPGYYEIWFNTSIVTVSSTETFYIIPSISQPLYAVATTKSGSYCWVRPIIITVTPFLNDNFSAPLQTMSVLLNENNTIHAIVNVTDAASCLDTESLSIATINYTISSVYAVISNDTMKYNETTHMYQFTLPAFALGQYIITITAAVLNTTTGTPQNYTVAVATFVLNVNKIPIKPEINADLLSVGVSVPFNHNTSVEINVTDVYGNPLANVSFVVTLNGHNYTADGTNTIVTQISPGVFLIALNSTAFNGLQQNTGYLINVTINKDNYVTETFNIALHVGFAVDPIFGVPYIYWEIIAVTLAIMIAGLLVARAIAISRIPIIIRNIDKATLILRRKRAVSASDLLMGPTLEGILYKMFSSEWSKADADMMKALGVTKEQLNLDRETGKNAAKKTEKGNEERAEELEGMLAHDIQTETPGDLKNASSPPKVEEEPPKQDDGVLAMGPNDEPAKNPENQPVNDEDRADQGDSQN